MNAIDFYIYRKDGILLLELDHVKKDADYKYTGHLGFVHVHGDLRSFTEIDHIDIDCMYRFVTCHNRVTNIVSELQYALTFIINRLSGKLYHRYDQQIYTPSSVIEGKDKICVLYDDCKRFAVFYKDCENFEDLDDEVFYYRVNSQDLDFTQLVDDLEHELGEPEAEAETVTITISKETYNLLKEQLK